MSNFKSNTSSSRTKAKYSTLIEKYKAIQAIGNEIEIPWAVKCMFSGRFRLEVLGSEVTFGEDYVSVQQARASIEWLANQLGGKVKWK